MKQISLIVLSFFCTIWNNNLFASHAQGADLTYKYLGGNQYQIQLTFYRACSGIAAASSLVVEVQSDFFACGQTTTLNTILTKDNFVTCPDNITLQSGNQGCEVKGACSTGSGSTCVNSASQYPGLMALYYKGIVTLPFNCSKWQIRFTENARNNSNNIVSAATQNLSLISLINNEIINGDTVKNTTPIFTNQPLPFLCTGRKVMYNNMAVDNEGDSLVYELIAPLGTGFQPISFTSLYSLTNPIRTMPNDSFKLDSKTGQIEYTPSHVESNTISLKVSEYRNGVLVGFAVRDIQFVHINCSGSQDEILINPVSNVVNGSKAGDYHIKTCAGSNVSFKVPLQYSGLLHRIRATSSLSVSSVVNSSGDSITVSCNVSPSDYGLHYIYIHAENDKCPIINKVAKAIKLEISYGADIIAATTTYCGTPLQLTVSDGGFGTWQPTTNLVSIGGGIVTVAPMQSRTYTYSSLCGTDSVYIKTNSGFQASLVCDTFSCKDSVEVQLTTNATALPLQYQWSPAYISDTVFTHYLADTFNVLKCIITDTTGCEVTVSRNVRKWRFSNYAMLKAEPDSVNIGEQVDLKIVRTPLLHCGTGGQYPISTNAATAIVGSGLATLASPTTYPTIYGNFANGHHIQMLFKADELQLALNGSCLINKISFYVSQHNANATLHNFTIKIGCAGLDSLTGFVPISDVYFGPQNYVPTNQLNTHVLSKNFVWDGVSNVIVDVCTFGSTFGSANNGKQSTQTNFRSVYYGFGSTPLCGTTNQLGTLNATQFYLRPNIRLSYTYPEIEFDNFQWQPDTGVNAVNNPALLNTYSYPQTSQTYSVVIDTLGCIDTLKVNVVIDTTIYRLKGTSYFDYNKDTVQQSIEGSFPLADFKVMPSGTFHSTNRGGNFNVRVPKSTTAVHLQTNAYLNLTLPVLFTQYSDTVNLPLQNLVDKNDLSVSGFHQSPRFLTTSNIYFSVFNEGNTVMNGRVKLLLDTALRYVSSNPTRDFASNDTLIWEISNITPNQRIDFRVVVSIPFAFIGTPLKSLLTVATFEQDVHPRNNTHWIEGIVIGAYDPNDKGVQPLSYNSKDLADIRDLVYTIRFQNTGNDTAFYVEIRDTIDPLLSFNSFKVLAASHDFVVERKNNQVRFIFEHILLPDSNTNQEASNGYITYRIQPSANAKPLDIITNRASIYFDFNEPIVTNTTQTLIEIPSSVSSIHPDADFSIIPNPNNGKFYCRLNTNWKVGSVFEIQNVLGERVISSNLMSGYEAIEIDGLSKGIYFFTVISSNQKMVRKFVVQ